MVRDNVFKNTLMLTVSGIIAKTIDFSFRTYYSKMLGSEGCGLLSLVFGAYSIMLTFASAGVSVAVSKIISQHLSLHNLIAVKKTMRTALLSTFFSSLAIIFIVFLLYGFISVNILKDERTKYSLLFICPSILFMSVSYCYKGYFYSARKILIPASSEFVEQFVKITTISFLLSRLLPFGVEYGCYAVFLGLTLGEASSCLYLSLFYYQEHKKMPLTGKNIPVILPIIKIAFPSMMSSLSGAYLRMQEELLTVRGLEKYGFSHAQALGTYGTISGMVIPLTVFPLTLLSSFLSLLVPEISRAAARPNKERLQDVSKKVYKFAAITSFLVVTVLFAHANELAIQFYNKNNIGSTIMIFACILPISLFDSVSHGILNGLGNELILLIVTLSEAALRIIICIFLIPVYASSAIIITFYAGSLFSFLIKLIIISSKIKLEFPLLEWFGAPFFVCLFTVFLTKVIFINFIPESHLFIKIFITILCYIILILIGKIITIDEIKWVKSKLKG